MLYDLTIFCKTKITPDGGNGPICQLLVSSKRNKQLMYHYNVNFFLNLQFLAGLLLERQFMLNLDIRLSIAPCRNNLENILHPKLFHTAPFEI